MQAVWTTDIHLNVAPQEVRREFYRAIQDLEADMVFLTGDIAESSSLEHLLMEMSRSISIPIYFVLGNHDFYDSSIERVRQTATQLHLSHQRLVYLPQVGTIEVSPTTGLVGQDGWGDGQYGNFRHSPVVLNDHILIHDLKDLNRRALLPKLQELGAQESTALKPHLIQALERYPHVILLTHVPPFKEACWYQGQIGNDDWLPFFTCKAIGDLLLQLMDDRPHRNLTVYCGHTHHSGTAYIRQNLTVHTGAAEYGNPSIHSIVHVE